MCLHVLYMYLSVPGMIPNFDGSKKNIDGLIRNIWDDQRTSAMAI